MTTKVSISSAPALDLFPTTAADREAVAQFQGALDACVHGWHRGDTVVLLQNNVQELFGDMLTGFFKHTLTQQVGQPVNFTFSNSINGGQTIVQMPENKNAHLHFPTIANVPTDAPQSTQPTARPCKTIANIKKAPRPMNCWIIFRDAMHKKLKAENPHLTVQQISTRCSEIWHSLSPVEKKPWQVAAKSAKEEHLRVHPDYKYSPRKPGEKKKRQSRKAKQVPTFAADSSQFEFPTIMDLTTVAHDELAVTELPSSTDHELPAVDFGGTFADDVAQLMQPTAMFGMQLGGPIAIDPMHDAESLRHARLEAEFGTGLESFKPFDFLEEDTFAFRAGADGNATLPSIYSDLY